MSVDVSSQEVETVKRAVLSKQDTTSWFMLHYDPNASSSALTPLASGSDPALPQIKDTLRSSGEDMVYGYADIRGKGLVIAYISEGVGGVKRARAVVHSRAVASLFPDYAALVTISQPDELTDQMVAEKLGLTSFQSLGFDHESSSVPPHSQMNGTVIGDQNGAAPQMSLKDHGLNGESVSGRTVDHQDADLQSGFAGAQQAVNNGYDAGASQSEASHELEYPPVISSERNSGDTSSRAMSSDAPRFNGRDTTSPASPMSSNRAMLSHASLGPPVDIEPNRPPNGPENHSASAVHQNHGDSAFIMKDRAEGHHSSDRIAEDAPLTNTDLALASQETANMTPTTKSGRATQEILPSGGPAPSPLAQSTPQQLRQSPTTNLSPERQLDVRGISSSEFFPEQRNRKASLGSRLGSIGSAFGRGGSSSPKSPNIPASPQTPSQTNGKEKGSSPTVSRFMNSSLIRNFGRRTSGGPSPPASPKHAQNSGQVGGQGDVPPPVPPKDGPTIPSPSSSYTPYVPPPPETQAADLPPRKDSIKHKFGNFSGGRGISPKGEKGREGMSPSPSAKLALAAASQKSVRTESEIQERFRRDQEEKLREREKEKERSASGEGRGEVSWDDDEAGLPYDRDDNAESPRADGDVSATKETESVGARTRESFVGQEELPRAVDLAVGGEQATLGQADHIDLNSTDDGTVAEEDRMKAEERDRRESESAAQQDEAEERGRIEAKERARAGAAAEADYRARMAAEDRARIEAAEKARLQAEEEERARMAAEAKAREEAEAAEAARKKEEEEARKVAEEAQRREEEEKVRLLKLEEDRKRKDEIRRTMVAAHSSGGQLLSGAITVQTTKSMTWRRRHFSLMPTEMKLFKAEGDGKPIQTIHLDKSATISHTYEESQVQGSFKIVSSDGEEFYLYTDGPEDREAVLEGLAMITGRGA